MAIKLESTVKGIECAALLTIESPTENPAVGLRVENVRTLQGDAWKEDPTKGKQVVTFVGEDGPVELQGTVDQEKAIEISAAYKVVIETQISTQSLPAFEAGRKSRTLLAVSVLRVVEVWATPKKCVWRASEAAGAQAGARVFDPNTGRIESPAKAA